MRRLLPLIFLSAVAVLRADFLPPALVWDGDAFDAGDTSTGFEKKPSVMPLLRVKRHMATFRLLERLPAYESRQFF
jgi:hypothetical protein